MMSGYVTLHFSKLALTVAWKRGQRYKLRTNSVFIMCSTWEKPTVNACGEDENAFTNPVCKAQKYGLYTFMYEGIKSKSQGLVTST